ncbi:MAG: polyprenyl synthetase family protein [Polyangiaceae bacterium]|nr:polyprenyl synthetase family protein [Polyangiaceae bacterium]
MTLQVDAAVDSLARTAKKEAQDARLESRLSDAHSLLADDLAWVEDSLRKAGAEGPHPGTTAAQHLIERGGKRLRPMTVLLSARCFGDVPDSARHVATALELVHSATLLHDDVIDDGMERRGVPTSRRLWGNAVSILAGDLLLVRALSITQTHAPAAQSQLISTLEQLVNGEIVQLRGRSELDVSEATYDHILEQKTASLFRFATRVGSMLAGASEHEQSLMEEFGEAVGVSFQLVDDVLDYVGENTGKSLFADLREGKMTLPLVLALRHRPEGLQWIQAIHEGDETHLDSLQALVLDSGACEIVRQKANEQTERAVAALQKLPQTPARDLLTGVARELTARTR